MTSVADGAERHWASLEKALKERPLPALNGSLVVCGPQDFMLMDVAATRVRFKNIVTRQYLELLPDGTMRIPYSESAWERGFFDILQRYS